MAMSISDTILISKYKKIIEFISMKWNSNAHVLCLRGTVPTVWYFLFFILILNTIKIEYGVSIVAIYIKYEYSYK